MIVSKEYDSIKRNEHISSCFVHSIMVACTRLLRGTTNFMANDIQAVIWDLDGDILDSVEEHRLAWHRMAQEAVLVCTDDQVWVTFGMRHAVIFQSLWKA